MAAVDLYIHVPGVHRNGANQRGSRDPDRASDNRCIDRPYRDLEACTQTPSPWKMIFTVKG